MNIAIILIQAAVCLALALRLLLKSINQLMELSFHKRIKSLVKLALLCNSIAHYNCNVCGVSAKIYFKNYNADY